MSKALEAARRAIESHPAYDCGSTGDEEMARDAISAYLSALAEDEEVVERVARALCALANPPESLIDPADHSEFVRTEAIGYRADARAAIRAMYAAFVAASPYAHLSTALEGLKK